MHRHTFCALLALGLSTAACSDDTETDGEVGNDTQEFAGCERGVLEVDITGQDADGSAVPMQWIGGGVDPDTGLLTDDAGAYFVSTTYLQLQPKDAVLSKFGELTGDIIGELFGNPGLVGVQFGQSESCLTRRTLAVWTSEASMMEFAMGDAHMRAIAAIGELSRGKSATTHWTATSSAVTWEDAAKAVGDSDGPSY